MCVLKTRIPNEWSEKGSSNPINKNPKPQKKRKKKNKPASLHSAPQFLYTLQYEICLQDNNNVWKYLWRYKFRCLLVYSDSYLGFQNSVSNSEFEIIFCSVVSVFCCVNYMFFSFFEKYSAMKTTAEKNMKNGNGNGRAKEEWKRKIIKTNWEKHTWKLWNERKRNWYVCRSIKCISMKKPNSDVSQTEAVFELCVCV